MNVINVTINFEKGTCVKDGINLISGDYNSTKIMFNFDRKEGTKYFKLKNPIGEIVDVIEIINDEVILVSEDEEGNLISLFNMEGEYTFEVSLYEKNSRLTSKSNSIYAAKEQVVMTNEKVDIYLPIFDNLINKINNLTEEITNNEKQRSSNEKKRIANEENRVTTEKNRNEYFEKFKKQVENGDFDGKDYILTDEDKQEIADNLNYLVKDKTDEYNKNAELKVKEYNDNAEAKIKEYNDNADELIAMNGYVLNALIELNGEEV